MSWPPSPPIVVPVDFSGEEVAAVQTALAVAAKPEDVHLLHVLYPLDAVSPGVVFAEVGDQERRDAVQVEFDKILAKHGLPKLQHQVRIGDPGHEVCEYAEAVGAGLIVVPSHGYGGFKRFLLGSVAERIIRNAGCDVLVTRRSDAE